MMGHKIVKNILLLACFSLGLAPLCFASETSSILGSVVRVGQKDGIFVVINAGSKHGLGKDMILTTSRKMTKDRELSIPTGRIQVTELTETSAIARNLYATTDLAKVFFPKHPGLMVGDEVKVEVQELNENLVAAPVLRFPFAELFRDPGKGSQNYSLSDEGRKLLTRAAEQLYALSPGQIVIEAFTDAQGDAQDNLFESTQRSEVVRQFFMEAQPFHAGQVLSLGLGEGESDLENFSKDSIHQQRYLLIRATRLY